MTQGGSNTFEGYEEEKGNLHWTYVLKANELLTTSEISVEREKKIETL